MANNYNIVPLSIDSGLNSHEIAGGKNYLILLEAPSNANIQVQFNDNTADKIPLKKNFAIETNEASKIFITADAISGGYIKIGQSARSEDFKILPSPSLEFTDAVLNEMRFAPSGVAQQQTITAGSSWTFTKSGQTGIRFHSTDETGVELDSNTIKYPMFEEELFLKNVDTVKFYNDNASSITVTIWDM